MWITLVILYTVMTSLVPGCICLANNPSVGTRRRRRSSSIITIITIIVVVFKCHRIGSLHSRVSFSLTTIALKFSPPAGQRSAGMCILNKSIKSIVMHIFARVNLDIYILALLCNIWRISFDFSLFTTTLSPSLSFFPRGNHKYRCYYYLIQSGMHACVVKYPRDKLRNFLNRTKTPTQRVLVSCGQLLEISIGHQI